MILIKKHIMVGTIMKKRYISAIAFACFFLILTGCNSGNTKPEVETLAETPVASEEIETESSSEVGSAEQLFEQFVNGEIYAEILTSSPIVEGEGSINFNDLDSDPENIYMTFREGEQIDLDNDGENELIIDGPYGGMYLDVIDGKLYVFAAAMGNAGALSYTYYDDVMWIVISDSTHAGRDYHLFYKFEGGDNLVDSMSLMMENYYEDEDAIYTLNDESITEEEFLKLHEEIFGE